MITHEDRLAFAARTPMLVRIDRTTRGYWRITGYARLPVTHTTRRSLDEPPELGWYTGGGFGPRGVAAALVNAVSFFRGRPMDPSWNETLYRVEDNYRPRSYPVR